MSSDPHFEARLAAAKKAGARSGILTVIGVLVVAGALVAIVWQYHQAREARDAATAAQKRAEAAEAYQEFLKQQLAETTQQSAANLAEAGQTVESQRLYLENLVNKGGVTAPSDRAALEKFQATSAKIERQSDFIAGALEDVKQRSINSPSPRGKIESIRDRSKPFLQLVTGDEPSKIKIDASKSQLAAKYRFSEEVTLAKWVPDVTEVRYFHDPDDKEMASKILEDLKKTYGLRAVEIKLFPVMRYPKGYFQIAFAKGAPP